MYICDTLEIKNVLLSVFDVGIVRSSDGWGDDNWSNDWGSGNNSLTTSPTQGGRNSATPSPNARASKTNSHSSSSGKMKASKSKVCLSSLFCVLCFF